MIATVLKTVGCVLLGLWAIAAAYDLNVRLAAVALILGLVTLAVGYWLRFREEPGRDGPADSQ